jgi:tetratricopeptide (TPR) repeat protein
MRRLAAIAMVFLPSLGLMLPIAAQQQSSCAPPAQQNQAAPNAPAPQKPAQPVKKKPSEAEQNPFPEAQSEAAAQQPHQDSTSSEPAAQNEPDAPQPATQDDKPSSTAKNPFPEAQSESAQHSQQQSTGESNGQPPAPAPNSDKTPGDYSSSHLKLLDLPGGDTSSPDAGAGGHNAALAAKDTQVGTFYLRTGDYKGAYDRFDEAAKADPGNADAVFGLAESARRLNRRDEAIRNYQLYLSALPDGPRAKDSRKALKELGATPNS